MFVPIRFFKSFAGIFSFLSPGYNLFLLFFKKKGGGALEAIYIDFYYK